MPGLYLDDLSKTCYPFSSMFVENASFLRNLQSVPARNIFDVEPLKLKQLQEYCVDPTYVLRSKSIQAIIPVRQYKRINNMTYITNGLRSEISKSTKKKTAAKLVTTDGVKGLSVMIALLYFNFMHYGPDPFHCIMNCFEHLIQWLLNVCSTKSKSFNNKNNVHQHFSDEPMISKTISEKIETAVQCIVVPFGHKNNFQVKHIFSRIGLLRGTAKDDIITNLLDFIMLQVDSCPAAYRTYFHLFSMMFARLSGTKISRSSYEQLCNNVIEITAMHDLLFPATCSVLAFHRPIDIVHHIQLHGPVRNFTTLGNERANGIIKEFIPKGGSRMEIITLNNCINYENSQMSHHYGNNSTMYKKENFYKDSVGVLHYTDEPFNLFNPVVPNAASLQYSQSSTETSEMIAAIVWDILIRYENNHKAVLHSSTLSRILYSFENKKLYFAKINAKNRNDNITKTQMLNFSFQDWIKDTIQKHGNVGYSFSSDLPEEDENIQENMKQGKIYECDLKAMKWLADNNQLKYNLFNSANIFGTKIHARGFQKRETNFLATSRYGEQVSEDAFAVGNPLNLLSDHWYKQSDASSWCKYTASDGVDLDSADVNTPYCYGQVNAYLQVSVPFDLVANRVCIASVVGRKHETYRFVDHIIGYHTLDQQKKRCSLSLSGKDLFVPCIAIHSTPILQVGYSCALAIQTIQNKKNAEDQIIEMTKNSKPIYVGKKLREDIVESHMKYIANPSGTAVDILKNLLSFLCIFPLKRNRYNCKHNDGKKERKNFLKEHGKRNVGDSEYLFSMTINKEFHY